MTSGDVGGEATGPVRVMIVDDHALLAQSLTLALVSAGIDVARCTALEVDAIVDAVARARSDIVLLDLDLGPGRGTSLPAIPSLSASGATVVMLTGVTDEIRLAECIEAGAVGVVDKGQPFEQLLATLHDVVRRGRILDQHERQEQLSKLRKHRQAEKARLAEFERLTPREADVLKGLLEGKSAERIATEEFVSVATVRTHIRTLLSKLGVNSQLAAVALARRAGWQPPESS
jgi:DNA-binding NarL/FixJ family response regulator